MSSDENNETNENNGKNEPTPDGPLPDGPLSEPVNGEKPALEAAPPEEEAVLGDDGLPEEDLGQEDEDPHRAMQRAIIEEARIHACFDGWTDETLRRAALDAGYEEGDAALAFPRGPVDAIVLYMIFADEEMAEGMETLDLDTMRTRDKVAIAVRLRLESQVGIRDAVGKAMRVLADPRHTAEGAKGLGRTVDLIWRIAGDSSTDFNYYTKRGLLAGVYSATLLYWLNDNSEDQAKTWEFLNKRLGEVLRVGQAASGIGKIADRLPNPFKLCGNAKRRWREGPVFR
jgi:ubiquinone biosynthesis protein COQ9